MSNSLWPHRLLYLYTEILKWVAMTFSRGSSQPRDQTQVSRIAGSFFTLWTTRGRINVLLNSVVKVGLIMRVRFEQTWSRFGSWPNSYKEQEHTRQGGEWDHSPEYGSLLGSFRKLLETNVAVLLRARKREREKEVRTVIWIQWPKTLEVILRTLESIVRNWPAIVVLAEE